MRAICIRFCMKPCRRISITITIQISMTVRDALNVYALTETQLVV